MIGFATAIIVLSAIVVLIICRGILRSAGGGKSAKLTGIAAAAMLPVAAFALYWRLGAPESVTASFQPAAEQSDTPQLSIDDMVTGLAARLDQNPDDINGWRMLGRSYGVLGQNAASANAYGEVVRRDPDANTADWRNYAAARIASENSDDGAFSEETITALRELESREPNDPLALFYLGSADFRAGDPSAALARWRRLTPLLPEDSPLTPVLAEMIAKAEQDG